MVTLRRAAELTGKSKSTLARAIKAGRLSASRNAEGVYAIDPAELARAYPLTKMQDARRDAPHGAPHDASRNSSGEQDETAILRLRLSLLTDERDRERTAADREREQLTATVADLRARLDRAEQRITVLISDQTPRTRRSWWARWQK